MGFGNRKRRTWIHHSKMASKKTYFLLLSQIIILTFADCDLHGLCREMRKRERLERDICERTATCESPRRMNCMTDTLMIVKHNCMITDCMEVQALADVGQPCETWFPRVVGTAFERYPQGKGNTLEPLERRRFFRRR